MKKDKPPQGDRSLTDWELKDLNAQNLIVRSIDNVRIAQVLEKQTAKDMIIELKELYGEGGSQH